MQNYCNKFSECNTNVLCLPKYLHMQTFANIVDLDQTLQNVVSDQGLPCSSLIQQFFDI